MTEYRDIVGPQESSRGSDIRQYQALADLPPASEFMVVAKSIDSLLFSDSSAYFKISGNALSTLSLFRSLKPETTQYIKVATIGPIGRDFTEIADALADNEYNLIIVDPGTYYKKFTIYRDFVSIICPNGMAVIDGIDYAIDTGTVFAGGAHIVGLLNTANCYFENITVKNSNGFGFKDYSVGAADGGHVFVNCHAQDCFISGFHFSSGNNVTYKCTGSYNCQYLPVGAAEAGEHSDGFGVFGDNAFDNEFYYCLAAYNGDDGFDCYRSKRTIFHGCVSAGNGYHLGARERPHTEPEIFAGNGYGFKLGGSTDGDFATATATVVKHNTAYLNRYAGFATNGGGAMLLENNIALQNHVEQKTSEVVGSRNFWIGENLANVVKNNIANVDSVALGALAGITQHNNLWQMKNADNTGYTLSLDDFYYDPATILFTKKVKDYPYLYTGMGDSIVRTLVTLEEILIRKFG